MRLKKLYSIAFFTFFTSMVMNAQNYIQCEDTCTHVHGIDLSHYQGDVFWETVGDNSKMAYAYLKATEGGDRIDHKYESNIELESGFIPFFPPQNRSQQTITQFHDTVSSKRTGSDSYDRY